MGFRDPTMETLGRGKRWGARPERLSSSLSQAGQIGQMTMETTESQPNGSVARSETNISRSSISTLAQVSVAGSGTGRGSPAVALVQLPSGQTVQVQGVIQASQPSVIQSAQIQAVQVAAIAETDESAESADVIEPHSRREILSRRSSYRKILNELSSEVTGVPKIEEEKSEEEGTSPNISPMAVPTSIYQTSTGQYSMYAKRQCDIFQPLVDIARHSHTVNESHCGVQRKTSALTISSIIYVVQNDKADILQLKIENLS
uniref:cAMP-responsive element modulator n=1 Tax=Ornithorhynchus anatinus TaxID=9258 RepID=A0A6I8PKJ4_ORNAN